MGDMQHHQSIESRGGCAKGGPTRLDLYGLGGQVAVNNCGLLQGAAVPSYPHLDQQWQTWQGEIGGIPRYGGERSQGLLGSEGTGYHQSNGEIVHR